MSLNKSFLINNVNKVKDVYIMNISKKLNKLMLVFTISIILMTVSIKSVKSSSDWNDFSLSSSSNNIIIFQSNTPHNLTIFVNLTKLNGGSFNIQYQHSDYIEVREFDSSDNISIKIITEFVILGVRTSKATTASGIYLIDDLGTVLVSKKVDDGLTLGTIILSLILLVVIRNKKNNLSLLV